MKFRKGMRRVMTCAMAILLAAAMTAPAHAAQSPFAQMEAQSRQAVEAAIKAGTVPPGTTIYDCMYGADENGVTIVIQYKDKNGNWIDVATGKKVEDATESSSHASDTQQLLTADELKAYAQKVFELANKEREIVGLEPVSYREDVADAAQIRAKELASVTSHTRPDGSKCFTVLDEQGIRRKWSGENLHCGTSTPESAMQAWMDSDGHRAIILNEKSTAMGVGVYQAQDGTIYWIQLFIKEK